jgi:hypothetical protein
MIPPNERKLGQHINKGLPKKVEEIKEKIEAEYG